MQLYHFCAACDVDSIIKTGINKGACPIFRGYSVRFIKNCQWLTSDPEAKSQKWNVQELIQYSRTAYRLTVIIPKKHCRNLIKATEFAKQLPVESQGFITEYPGHDSWYVYRGPILPQWIKKVEKEVENEKSL